MTTMRSQDIAHQKKKKRGVSISKKKANHAKIRVFLADDHPLIRVGIAEIIGRESDMVVCGEASTIKQTMKLFEQCNPDAVCVDITLAGEDGINLVKRIRFHHPTVNIIVYTMHEADSWKQQAKRAGANAYVKKQEPPEVLVKTIRLLMQG